MILKCALGITVALSFGGEAYAAQVPLNGWQAQSGHPPIHFVAQKKKKKRKASRQVMEHRDRADPGDELLGRVDDTDRMARSGDELLGRVGESGQSTRQRHERRPQRRSAQGQQQTGNGLGRAIANGVVLGVIGGLTGGGGSASSYGSSDNSNASLDNGGGSTSGGCGLRIDTPNPVGCAYSYQPESLKQPPVPKWNELNTKIPMPD